MLALAAILLVFIGLAHSYLGERYILMRLFRRPLPPLLGDDSFTKKILRFAWHITSIAWFGFAALLVLPPSPSTTLITTAAVFSISGLVSLIASRGRHYSYIVFFLVALLCVLADNV